MQFDLRAFRLSMRRSKNWQTFASHKIANSTVNAGSIISLGCVGRMAEQFARQPKVFYAVLSLSYPRAHPPPLEASGS